MNRLEKKTLLSLVTVSLALPLLLAPLPPALSVGIAHAAGEAPASPDDPARKQLLYEISIFERASVSMSPSSMWGSLSDDYQMKYADRIISETTSIAQSANSTPSQLSRALKYVQFSLDDYIEKGNPDTWYILHKILTYLYMHFPVSDAPGGYSQAKLDVYIQQNEALLARVNAGENRDAIFKEYIIGAEEFYAHPNP
ncbi:hypothetical protein CDO73_07050 [Saccharibacillus sp. O23]|uniref:hypothetical protein n=1 Tax=Saccharibacillus sp. O23 TaxID=2009338 RepID=UPI000B4E248E|nr:hypothetical protein [Saccharibacillus sp. O23]OWR31478.1 hypothetical protein CDO73_07050 [Saccharibacillus sp. O23]